MISSDIIRQETKVGNDFDYVNRESGGGGERDFKNNNIIKMIDLFRGGEPHVCTYL